MWLTLCISLLLTTLIYAYFKTRRPPGMPPGPSTYPFIGNFNLVYNNHQFHETLHRLAKEYGPFFSKFPFQKVFSKFSPSLMHGCG